MKNFIYFSVLLICIITLAQARPSYYYSNKDSSGYHPPYDFTTYEANGDSSCGPLCNAANEVIQANPNFVSSSSGTCTNLPSFITQQTDLPGLNFDNCCGFYESCAQQCGNTKEFCDQQFYGCLWSQCGYNYRVRPADRLICRSYAACFSSYMAFNMSCDQFNFNQGQACQCVSSGSVVPTPSPSVLPTPSASSLPGLSASPVAGFSASASPIVGGSASSSPVVSSSPSSSPVLGGSASSSPVPSASPVVGRRQASENSTGSSSPFNSTSSTVDNVSSNTYTSTGLGAYLSRAVPSWDTMSTQCPPVIENYINVMSDQEMDDITFWNSGSSLKMWWDLF